MNGEQAPTPTGKTFRIHEEDLVTLEHILPRWFDQLYQCMDNQLRTQCRQVQRVLTDVRWGYGPPMEVISFPADGPVPDMEDDED